MDVRRRLAVESQELIQECHRILQIGRLLLLRFLVVHAAEKSREAEEKERGDQTNHCFYDSDVLHGFVSTGLQAFLPSSSLVSLGCFLWSCFPLPWREEQKSNTRLNPAGSRDPTIHRLRNLLCAVVVRLLFVDGAFANVMVFFDVSAQGGRSKVHSDRERACCTISTSTFRVSAGLLTSFKSAMRAPRMPSGVRNRT